MYSLSGMMDRGPSKYSMSVSMYRGGGRGYGRPESAPPDLPSLLLDARICYLGMPVSHYFHILLLHQYQFDLFIYLVMLLLSNLNHFTGSCLITADCTCSHRADYCSIHVFGLWRPFKAYISIYKLIWDTGLHWISFLFLFILPLSCFCCSR